MTMVPIRLTSVLRTSPNNNGGRHHPTYRLIFCSASIAALGLTAIYLLSPRQPYDPRQEKQQQQQQQQQQQLHDVASLRGRSGSDLAMITKEKTGGRGGAQKNKDELDEEDLDPLKITQGSITYNGNNNNVSYYHCGPLPSSTSMQSISSSSSSSSSLTELILLHGAAFTKENWKTSGILDMFCEINNTEDEGNLSVLALDLPVSADGTELGYVFDALVSRKILSGLPVTFVTPSASGHAIVSLAEESAMSSTTSMNEEAEVKLTKGGSDHTDNLTRMVKAWIPVASFAVLSASDDTLLQYTHANIPILAIHGDQDIKGKRVTERLKDTNKNNAKGVELEGRHPVYLDSPEEFVREVMQFLDEMGL